MPFCFGDLQYLLKNLNVIFHISEQLIYMKLNCHENARHLYPCWRKGHCFHYKRLNKKIEQRRCRVLIDFGSNNYYGQCMAYFPHIPAPRAKKSIQVVFVILCGRNPSSVTWAQVWQVYVDVYFPFLSRGKFWSHSHSLKTFISIIIVVYI